MLVKTSLNSPISPMMMLVVIAFLLSLWQCSPAEKTQAIPTSIVSQMGISVQAQDNRPVSFTNKEAAYYYTQSHLNDHPEHSWFRGLNIAKNRVFQGYQLWLEGVPLNRMESELMVYPHKSIRTYSSGLTETFWMYDYVNAIDVELDNTVEQALGINLNGATFEKYDSASHTVFYQSLEGEYSIALAAIDGQALTLNDTIVSGSGIEGFLIVAEKDQASALTTLSTVRTQREVLKQKREARLNAFLSHQAYNQSNDSTLTMALNWLNVTMDQLVTQQHGDGIYAGLPWFNEYWGRDEFIALPGACLVTGEFEVARNILQSFAQYQDTDSTSIFFGRVPNIVNPDNIDYHTTDGTPRFIIQLQEYVKYSGDTSIIKALYPNVKYSIEGALKNWTDAKGYLLHKDNETWMDARRNYDKLPYSPRGTRANDIQALWYQQLLAGVYFANYMQDSLSALKWQSVAEKARKNFESDFTSPDKSYIADRLDENDQAEYRLRPNQLFVFEMIENDRLKATALKACWEELTYPWGVASLDRNDPFFHPFHLKWAHYHKDEAYHNGTVWLWLNGIAMQRMIEARQIEKAYTLFQSMNNQALTAGVVGGLGENSDAYPAEGEEWPKLTGTYLQAWSNAEQLRVWYQYFLGFQPDLINNTISIVPNIPESLQSLHAKIVVGKGHIDVEYSQAAGATSYQYHFQDVDANIQFQLFPYALQSVEVADNSSMAVRITHQEATLVVESPGEASRMFKLEKAAPTAYEQLAGEVLQSVQFCTPADLDQHDVLKKAFKGSRGI